MLFDLYKMIPGINLAGVDISEYAINNSPEEIKKNLTIANVKKLPFPPKSFDVVISINTVHNLEKDECALAIQEISRVSKKHSLSQLMHIGMMKKKRLKLSQVMMNLL